MPGVNGFCPMGCGRTLQLDKHGLVHCGAHSCPRSCAAALILSDRETEHVVEISFLEFTLRHPLRERLDDELMRCTLHSHLAEFGESYLRGEMTSGPVAEGRYRIHWEGDGEDAYLDWEAI